MKYTGNNADKFAEFFGCRYFEHVKDGESTLHLLKNGRTSVELKIGDEFVYTGRPMINLS